MVKVEGICQGGADEEVTNHLSLDLWPRVDIRGSEGKVLAVIQEPFTHGIFLEITRST